jgi:micrococcal nuclease
MKIVKCLILIVSFVSGVSNINAQNKMSIEVTKVVDGDTFYGRDSLGTDIKFRLIGVDCPESRHPRKPKQPSLKKLQS